MNVGLHHAFGLFFLILESLNFFMMKIDAL